MTTAKYEWEKTYRGIYSIEKKGKRKVFWYYDKISSLRINKLCCLNNQISAVVVVATIPVITPSQNVHFYLKVLINMYKEAHFKIFS